MKKVFLTNREEELIIHQIRLLPSVLGKRYGSLFPKIQASIAVEDQEALVQSIRSGCRVNLKINGRIITLQPEEMQVETQAREGWMIAQEQGIIVGVNIQLTNLLISEGLARDIVRRIQNQRKNADFKIADEVETYYETGPKLNEVFGMWSKYIREETLSTALYRTKPPKDAYTEKFELAGEKLLIGLVRVQKDFY